MSTDNERTASACAVRPSAALPWPGVRMFCAVTAALGLTACPETESEPEATGFGLTSQALWRAGARADPVLAAGRLREQGLWNDPHVLKLGDEYVMYMASSIERPFRPPIVPFRAVSDDGFEWSLSPTAPLLSPRGTPFENIETPSVVLHDGVFHMYYTGVYAEGTVPSMAIGHAVSKDGVHWEDEQRAVIEATGTVSDWNGYLVAEPGAVVHEDKIYLYFTAMAARPGGDPPQLQTIGLATSDDGYEFDEPRLVLRQSESLYPATRGFVGYSTPFALVLDSRVHLFYDVAAFVAGGNPEWQQVALHHAVSDDGVTEFREDSLPLLVREDFHFTSGEILAPSALVDDDELRMWFSGHVSYPELLPFVNRGYEGNEFGIGYTSVPLERLRATQEQRASTPPSDEEE